MSLGASALVSRHGHDSSEVPEVSKSGLSSSKEGLITEDLLHLSSSSSSMLNHLVEVSLRDGLPTKE